MSSLRAPEEALLAVLMGVGRQIRQRFDGDEIDPTLLPLMRALKACGPTRHGSLAESLNLDASTVSRQVRQLLDRGYAEASTDAQDARARQVALTPQGAAALKAAVRRRLDLIADVLAGWPSQDAAALGALLDRLDRDLSTRQNAPTPAQTEEPA